MNFAIRYLTRYLYDGDVADNLNALRVKPATTGRQRCDEFSVRLTPEVRLHRHTDYFGTEVVEFEVSRPHRELTIDVRARVTTKPPPQPPQATWDALGDPSYRESGGEFLLQTDDAAQHPTMSDLLATTRAAASPLSMLSLIAELIPDRFEYRQGATYVDSTVQDLLDGGAGVCQDFVHLGLCLLRHHGIAARYVSGYLFAAGEDGMGGSAAPDGGASGGSAAPDVGALGGSAAPDGGALGGSAVPDGGASSQESVEVDTHAWLEALLPVPGGGEPVWVGADPTNRGIAGEDHVKIGHGRHYPDVPPTKGVYRGAATSTLEASVTMTRLDGVDPASIARA